MSTVVRDEAEQVCDALAVVAEPHRLLVLRHLRRGARSAGFLAASLGISPSLASHHLAVLVDAGLVTRRHKGQFVCYAADRARVARLYRRLGQLAGVAGAASDEAARRDGDPC